MNKPWAGSSQGRAIALPSSCNKRINQRIHAFKPVCRPSCMPVRVLQHGFAPSTENYGMEPGAWSDIPVHAQFLIDLEFLMRYTQPSGASCLYCQSPPYLKEIASHFPWVHFYAYGHAPDPSPEEEEYDPAQPQLVTRSPPDVQVNGNTTTAAYPFTKEIAVRLGENSATVNRVMVCHGLDSMRQLCLHSMLRPRFSLLDVQGPIPEDYIEGELMLPMFIANHKIFVSLVASQQSGARRYNPSLFKDEMGEPCAVPEFL